MKSRRHPKAAGTLFLVSGIAFMTAAALAGQVAFTGVGAAFISLGVVFLAKARKDGQS